MVVYDSKSLTGSVISVNDTKFLYGFTPLDGDYSVGLEGRLGAGDATIGQTGLIPSDSFSVVFLFRDEYVSRLDVSFKGNILPYSVIWSEPGFDICSADIARFAGQTGELRFTENSACNVLDDIYFSADAVPEPGTVGLFAMGALAMAGRFWCRTTRSVMN